MHVIPVEKAISMENQSIDIEHISYWLKKYEGHIGASICSCRYGRKKLDEGCADDYQDWCISVGDMAAARPAEAAISPTMKQWQYSKEPRTTATSTR